MSLFGGELVDLASKIESDDELHAALDQKLIFFIFLVITCIILFLLIHSFIVVIVYCYSSRGPLRVRPYGHHFLFFYFFTPMRSKRDSVP